MCFPLTLYIPIQRSHLYIVIVPRCKYIIIRDVSFSSRDADIRLQLIYVTNVTTWDIWYFLAELYRLQSRMSAQVPNIKWNYITFLIDEFISARRSFTNSLMGYAAYSHSFQLPRKKYLLVNHSSSRVYHLRQIKEILHTIRRNESLLNVE